MIDESKIARVVRAARAAQTATQQAAATFVMLDAARREYERLQLLYAQAQLDKLAADRALADAADIDTRGIARRLTLESARYSKLDVRA